MDFGQENKCPLENKVVVLDRGDYTTCTIHEYGAIVTSWKINNREHLFMSRSSRISPTHHVRGGICLSYPVYGCWRFGRRHGFSRNSPWRLIEGPTYLESGDVYAVFTLQADAYTKSFWNRRFNIFYKITLREMQLQFEINVFNMDKFEPLEFSVMQHTYIRVPNITKCKIIGLRNCTYYDKILDKKNLVEDRDEVSISEYTDRIYKNTPQVLFLTDLEGGAILKLSRKLMPDFNLWNPWAEHVLYLDPDEYKYFLAPEIGHLGNTIHLDPMCDWHSSQTLEVIDTTCKYLGKNFYDYFENYC